MGDIGLHFPDNDDRYRGITSLLLLEHVGKLLTEEGYTVLNLDATVIAEKPKISPYRSDMQENISRSLSISKKLVNVKATTTEGLGSFGRGEGIGAMCIALIGHAPLQKTVHA
jgi:2-C-methyl-D-erythritol 2,4-cyclodiphosphate synthase